MSWILYYFPEICFLLSLILNSLLIFLILTKTRRDIGNYKYLILLFSLVNISYSFIDLICKPEFFMYKQSFIMFCNGPIKYTSWSWGILSLITNFFSLSFVLLGVHFIYRYIAICRSQQIFFFFKFPYCLLWIGTALLICFNWEFSISYFLRSNEEMKIYLRQPFFSEYGRDIDNEVFYGVLYYVNDEGTIHFRWYYCAVILNLTVTLVFVFSIILFCGIRICHELFAASFSTRTKNIQLQLFRLLLAQMIISIALCYAPCSTILFLPFLDLNSKIVCMFGSFAMSFYPVIDPLICIYYFKDYRRAVLSILKAFKSTQQKPGNVGEFRSTTAY